MSQFYSDPSREADPHALPNCEVFYVAQGEMENEEGEHLAPGFYWWACFPSCLPDGDPMGPYATEQEAIEAAQDE